MKLPIPRSRITNAAPRATPKARPRGDDLDDDVVGEDDGDETDDIEFVPLVGCGVAVAELSAAASLFVIMLNPLTGTANIVAEEDITDVED